MYEATNPPDIEESVVRDAVEPYFPQIADPKIRFHYHGTYNVYIVEEKYLFRFPSTTIPILEQQNLVQREVILLERLRNHLTYEIPRPEFVNVNSDPPYMGYRMIPGDSLTNYFDSANDEQKVSLGNQIGGFLSQLHAIDGSSLGIGDDGAYNPKESHTEFQKMFSQIQDSVFPELSKSEREWIDRLFHDFLDSSDNLEFEPVLQHGDFDTSNILVNPETFQVTGIIDFEETRVYDPASDFIFLSEGVVFLKSLLDAYSGKIDLNLGKRVIARFGRQPFFYILWGIENNLEPMVSYGYTALREIIENWECYVAVAERCFKF
jgi:aminoglycoside phosphotransferase (APT) family kinase protein